MHQYILLLDIFAKRLKRHQETMFFPMPVLLDIHWAVVVSAVLAPTAEKKGSTPIRARQRDQPWAAAARLAMAVMKSCKNSESGW
jgi:hypothetical protein